MIRSQTFTRYAVRCDNCGYQTVTMADGQGSEELAVEYAVRRGWEITDDEQLCPTCALFIVEPQEPCS